MDFLSLVASITQRGVVVSEQVLDQYPIPFFSLGDAISGKITVVSETGDPTDPTDDVTIDSSSGIALTDGEAVVYAQATNLQVSTNELTFDLVVNSAALLAALTASSDGSIEAFLEVRITKDSQDELLLREPTTIFKTATSTLPVPVLPVRLYYNQTITSLRGELTSLEAIPTASIYGEGSLLLIKPDNSVSGWLWIAGPADVDDPDGQVAPLDYDLVTNDFHWQKSLGF